MQFDSTRKPWWVLQDAGGDVAALCDNGTSITGTPFVAAQWTYDAYGAVLSADHLAPHPFLHLGHKGLFFDRLDVGIAGAAVPGANADESPRLVPFAKSVYYARNRSYLPDLGRWMQADPNASGQTLSQAALYNGEMRTGAGISLDIAARLGGGGSLYQYLASNVYIAHDPSGLEPTLVGQVAVGGIQGLLFGSLFGGAVGAIASPGHRLDGALQGAAIGGAAGATFGVAAPVFSAFAASASGLFATLGVGTSFAGGIAAGAVSGVVVAEAAGYVDDRAVSNRELAANALFGAALSGATSIIAPGLRRAFVRIGLGQADSAILATAGAGRFASAEEGLITGFVTVEGESLEYALQWKWSGKSLRLQPVLYPPKGGAQEVRIGTNAIRQLIKQLKAEGYASGADDVTISYFRRGSTGGVYNRPVDLK